MTCRRLRNESITLYFLLFMVLQGCLQEQSNENNHSLKKTGSKEFPLDEDTGPVSLDVNYVENETGGLYVHFNSYRSKFLLYNYSTGTLKKKISFIKTYPPPSCANFYNCDTIIFIYDSERNIIILLDSLGNEFRKIDTNVEKFNFTKRSISCKTFNPLLFRGDKIFYSHLLYTEGYPKSSKYELSLGGAFNINTGIRDNFIYFPDFYFQANWGYTNYRQIYHCFNEDEMIVSFAAADFLYKYSLNTYSLDSVRATSQYIKKIEPLSTKSEINTNLEKSARYFASNPSYGPVYYDKYRKVYYRFAELPRKKGEFDPNDPMGSVRKPQSIIILDKDFRKIGETKIGDKYIILNTIITPDGILLNRLETDETKIIYDIYTLTSKKTTESWGI